VSKIKKTDKENISAEFLAKLNTITAKRAKIVIDHILRYGFVTTDELKEVYGYDHPPRAVRDVRERGIPIVTFKVKGKNNRNIAAYQFGDPRLIHDKIINGRKRFSKQFKTELVELQGSKCAICSTKFESRYLQIDHCIPFEIIGETDNVFMLLCGSCNRVKSWSCEHCYNWSNNRNIETCQSCYWANPACYSHIAMNLIRRLDLTWTEQEVETYEKLKEVANKVKKPLSNFVKNIIEKHVNAYITVHNEIPKPV
jgi:hypothetical protein